jgi:hypothetical protein
MKSQCGPNEAPTLLEDPMIFRPTRRMLIGAASLLTAVALGLVASTTADASSKRHPMTLPMGHVAARQAGRADVTLVPQSYGGDQEIGLQALKDQNSFRYAMHWDVTGAYAKDMLDIFQNAFGENYPDFVPQTNSASFAAAAKDDKVFSIDVTGAFVRPDRVKQTIKIGENTLTEWLIGRKLTTQYNKEKAQTITVDLDADQDVLDSYMFAALWDNGFWEWYDHYADDGVLSCKPQDDKVNEITVRVCKFNMTDDDEVASLLQIYGSDSFAKIDSATYQLYLADETQVHDAPVRLKIQVSGKDSKSKAEKLSFTMDITDLNKKTVTVDAGK